MSALCQRPFRPQPPARRCARRRLTALQGEDHMGNQAQHNCLTGYATHIKPLRIALFLLHSSEASDWDVVTLKLQLNHIFDCPKPTYQTDVLPRCEPGRATSAPRP